MDQEFIRDVSYSLTTPHPKFIHIRKEAFVRNGFKAVVLIFYFWQVSICFASEASKVSIYSAFFLGEGKHYDFLQRTQDYRVFHFLSIFPPPSSSTLEEKPLPEIALKPDFVIYFWWGSEGFHLACF